MSDIDKKILRKIAKCLALSRSPEPAEAAAAMRQAQKLMEKYGVSKDDVEIAEVIERLTGSGSRSSRPPLWLKTIARTVSNAFGVARYWVPSFMGQSQYAFVGIEPAVTIAEYAFTVLRRKCKAARTNYFKSLRGRRANRLRKADAYAYGWAYSLSEEVNRFAKPVPKQIELYMEKISNQLTECQPIDRGRKNSEVDHFILGRIDGSKVSLQNGVSGINNPALGQFK